MLMPMKLIAGLGNPGLVYSGNRHNIGFACLGHFARECGIKLAKKHSQARIGCGEVAGVAIVLARPDTYMNNSGQAVRRLVDRFEISPGNLIVIHDDLDLPPGRIRIRQGGSSGGHKGVESIIKEMGYRDFIRIRIGIGRPAENACENDIINFVLSDFTPGEKLVIKPALARASDAILCLLTDSLETAMNNFNQ
jgi:PTH1 family peptidyl-tRNA hydrolase